MSARRAARTLGTLLAAAAAGRISALRGLRQRMFQAAKPQPTYTSGTGT
jgi:hypothetical protein